MNDLPPSAYRFEGFGPKAVDWFTRLEKNNSKPYFEANRALFEEQVREPMLALLMEASTRFSGDVKMFRPYRDIRFSKDKSPYKTAAYGIVRPPASGAALFAGISSQGLHAGAGYFEMASDQLDRFREAVAADATGEVLARIVARAKANDLTISGASLKSAPRSYPRDHPRLDLLRMKEIICGATLPPGDSLLDRRAFDFAMATWTTAKPLILWLDANVGPTTSGQPGKFGR